MMNHSLFSSNVSAFLGSNATCNFTTCLDQAKEKKYKFVLGVFMIFCMFLGIWFNGIIIILTIRHKFLRIPINYAMVNLSVADMFSIVIGLCPTMDANLKGYYFQSKSFCTFQGFCITLFGLVALWSVVVCAVERYLVVCRPFKALHFGKRHAVLALLFIWLWSVMWTIPPLFGWSSYDLESIASNCALAWHRKDWKSRSYHLSLFFCSFLVPFILISLSYGKLIFTLRKVAKNGLVQSNSTQRAESQVTKTAAIMILAFLLSWMPYAVFALTNVMKPEVTMDPKTQSIPLFMAKTGTVYNPVIYVCLNKQYREQVAASLQCLQKCWIVPSRHQGPNAWTLALKRLQNKHLSSNTNRIAPENELNISKNLLLPNMTYSDDSSSQ
ncbi:parapinopsin-like [Sceloporus undulatus]|uniref:parapinopsin-like n=1 Tax=Sceloporus undulatus TaxID=8520 RepID=UPI001C4C40CA|nr:parapinopsin-like [Sceloporus undulatus]